MKKLVFLLLAVLLIVLVAAVAFVGSLSNDLPEGTPGPEADALARAMMASVDDAAWQRTGAVSWIFRGTNAHVWDRQRGLAQVAWEEGDSLVETWLDLSTRQGLARRDGQDVDGEERAALLQAAWEHWCNDSFWLNPVAKVFDEGTRRSVVTLEDGEHAGRRGLLVEYTSGGVTPGDVYLWILGDDDRPVAWRMWTQILPVKGLETSWEGWTTLSTGAVVATAHDTPLGVLELSGVRGAASVDGLDLPRGDPFDVLRGEETSDDAAEPQPVALAHPPRAPGRTSQQMTAVAAVAAWSP